MNVHVKSDCLIGVDAYKTCHINILPLKDNKVPVWDISGEESDGGYSYASGGSCASGCSHDH